MGSIPSCCWVQKYQSRLEMGVVSSCMVLTMKEGPQNPLGIFGCFDVRVTSDYDVGTWSDFGVGFSKNTPTSF